MDGLLRRMPGPLLAEWMAFFELEPFGPAREDARAGKVAAAVANSRFGRGREAKWLTDADFFPNLAADEAVSARRMAAADMEAHAKAFTGALGGKVKKRADGKPNAG